MSEHWFISGANRGIGLEFVRQLKARGDEVTAGVRNDEARDALAARLAPQHAQAQTLTFDARDAASIRKAADSLSQPINVLVANAGAFGPQRQSTLEMDFEGALDLFSINALGPLRLAQALLPRLRGALNSAHRADVERAWFDGERKPLDRDLFGDEGGAQQALAMPRQRAEAAGNMRCRNASGMGPHRHGRPQRPVERDRERRGNACDHRRTRHRRQRKLPEFSRRGARLVNGQRAFPIASARMRWPPAPLRSALVRPPPSSGRAAFLFRALSRHARDAATE